MDISTVDTTLSPQTFYVLLALTDKTLHGYGIRDQVAHDSEGSIVMATGTTYSLLKRMVRQKLIEEVEADDERGRISCRYEITGQGVKRLKAEVARLERISQHARYKLAIQPHF